MATAQLPRLPVVNPGDAPVVGTNTVAAMTSGVFWGYIGLIEGLVTRIRAEREALEKRKMTVVGTGGLAGEALARPPRRCSPRPHPS